MPASHDQVMLRAFAKVNLTLEVLGKRPDGYHELRSLVQCISLADELTLRPTDGGITIRVSGQWAPEGPENLCYQAAELFIRGVGSPAGVDISLVKHIPAGRGLGGGSSDAATTLLGLAALAEHRPADAALHEMAAELGSDVSLFLGAGTAVISGRGETVQPVAAQWRGHALVVAWPDMAVSTTEAYRLLEGGDFTDGQITAAAQQALSAGQLASDRHLFNCFERAVYSHWPEVARLQERLTAAAGHPARLCGSGSALFAICADLAHAEGAAQRMHETGSTAVAVEPVYLGSHR